MSFRPAKDSADRPAAVQFCAAARQPRGGSAAPVLVTLLAGTVAAAAALIVALPVRSDFPAGVSAEEQSSPAAVTATGTSAAAAEPAASTSQQPASGQEHSSGKRSESADAHPPAETAQQADTAAENTIPLFDGKTLAGWKATRFGGEGGTLVKDGQLILETGIDLTGVTSTRKDLPRENYEVELDAMRVNGSDFFCGLTFPVGPDYCSLIVGGWGGGVVGISSLDGLDASENETTLYRELKNQKWYHIRLRVTADMIEAWLDEEQIVDVERAGRKISTRSEVDLSQPFGLASWQSTAALKNIRLRLLPEQPGDSADSSPAVKQDVKQEQETD